MNRASSGTTQTKLAHIGTAHRRVANAIRSWVDVKIKTPVLGGLAGEGVEGRGPTAGGWGETENGGQGKQDKKR